MPFQVSPGINVSEIDLTTVVPNVSTSIGCIAGGFQWGPVMERTSITTENDLVNTFGKPDSYTYQSHMVAANYLSYSNNLIVARAVGAAAMNSHIGDDDNGGGTTTVLNADDYDTDTYVNQLFLAKYPGVLGNSLKILAVDEVGYTAFKAIALASRSVDQALFISQFDRAPGTSTDVANAGGSLDEMHVLVIDEDGLWTGQPGEVLEKFAKEHNMEKYDLLDAILRYEDEYIARSIYN